MSETPTIQPLPTQEVQPSAETFSNLQPGFVDNNAKIDHRNFVRDLANAPQFTPRPQTEVSSAIYAPGITLPTQPKQEGMQASIDILPDFSKNPGRVRRLGNFALRKLGLGR